VLSIEEGTGSETLVNSSLMYRLAREVFYIALGGCRCFLYEVSFRLHKMLAAQSNVCTAHPIIALRRLMVSDQYNTSSPQTLQICQIMNKVAIEVNYDTINPQPYSSPTSPNISPLNSKFINPIYI